MSERQYFSMIVDARKHGHGPFWTQQEDGTFTHPILEAAATRLCTRMGEHIERLALDAMGNHARIEELESELSSLYAAGSASYENPDFWRSRVEDIQHELAELRNEPSWPRPIPVSERLPENLERVLVCYKQPWPAERFWVIAQHGRKTGWSSAMGWDPANVVTHWLPLPPLPPPPTE